MSGEVKGIAGAPVRLEQPASAGRQPETNAAAAASARNTPTDTDSVVLTDSAAHLRQVEQSLQTVSVVHAERVVAIRQAIADGTYQIDARRVADKLVAFEEQRNREGSPE